MTPDKARQIESWKNQRHSALGIGTAADVDPAQSYSDLKRFVAHAHINHDLRDTQTAIKSLQHAIGTALSLLEHYQGETP